VSKPGVNFLVYCLLSVGVTLAYPARAIADEAVPVDLTKPSGKVQVGEQTFEWKAVPVRRSDKPPRLDQLQLADKLLREGKPGQAEDRLRTYLATHGRDSDKQTLILVLRGIGTACWEQRKWTEAQASLKRAIDLQFADSKGETEDLAYDMRVVGQTYLEQGRASDAQEMFALGLHAIDHAQSNDAKPVMLRLELLNLLAGTMEMQGDWVKAEPLLERLYKLQTQHRDALKITDSARAATLKRLAQTRLAQNDKAAADRYLKEADKLAR